MSWTEIPNPLDATFNKFLKDINSTTIVATDVSSNVYYSVAGGAWTMIGNSPEGTGYEFIYKIKYELFPDLTGLFLKNTNGNVYYSLRSADGLYDDWTLINKDDVETKTDYDLTISLDVATLFLRNGNENVYYSFRSADGSYDDWILINKDNVGTGTGYDVLTINPDSSTLFLGNENENVYYSLYDDGSYGAWTLIQGTVATGTDYVLTKNSDFTTLFLSNGNENVYYSLQQADGSYGAWTLINNVAVETEGYVLTYNSNATTLFLGNGNKNVFFSLQQADKSYGDWTLIQGTVATGTDYVLTYNSDFTRLFLGNGNENVYYSLQQANGSYGAWTLIQGTVATGTDYVLTYNSDPTRLFLSNANENVYYSLLDDNELYSAWTLIQGDVTAGSYYLVDLNMTLFLRQRNIGQFGGNGDVYYSTRNSNGYTAWTLINKNNVADGTDYFLDYDYKSEEKVLLVHANNEGDIYYSTRQSTGYSVWMKIQNTPTGGFINNIYISIPRAQASDLNILVCRDPYNNFYYSIFNGSYGPWTLIANGPPRTRSRATPLPQYYFGNLFNNTYILQDDTGAVYYTDLNYLLTNICFPARTPIQTDQGIVAIERLRPGWHTIRRQAIVAVTQTITADKALICFAANALGPNCPSQETCMSAAHKVAYRGDMLEAHKFVRHFAGVRAVPYRQELLYNVLLERHSWMRVNGLVCETLRPDHIAARLFRQAKYRRVPILRRPPGGVLLTAPRH